VMGKSAIIAGFALTVMSIGWPIASAIAGRILLAIGYRNTSMIGGGSLLVGTIFFILLPTVQHYLWAGIGSFFVGVGMGMTSTAFIVAIQSTVHWEIRGSATAMNMFMRSIGSALGVALLGGILNNQINRKIEEANLNSTITVDAVDKLLDKVELSKLSETVVHILQEGLLTGLQLVYIGIGVIAVLAFIVMFFIPRK